MVQMYYLPQILRLFEYDEDIKCSILQCILPTAGKICMFFFQIPGLLYKQDKDKIICLNKKNKEAPKPPNYWHDKDVKCRDFKMR